jgi:hypothetical protein
VTSSNHKAKRKTNVPSTSPGLTGWVTSSRKKKGKEKGGEYQMTFQRRAKASIPSERGGKKRKDGEKRKDAVDLAGCGGAEKRKP